MRLRGFADLLGGSGHPNRPRPMKGSRLPVRQLKFDCLEERRLLTAVLGSAQDFAVLAHTTVTNTGPTVIFGSNDTLSNVGVFNLGDAGDAATGFSSAGNTFVGPGSHTDGPGIVNAPAQIHLGDAVANQARIDTFTAFDALASYGTATNLTGQDLGTSGSLPISTLVAGVYSFDTTAQLNGVLQLDAQGLDGGVWIFQIGSSLTTASGSGVELINPGGNMGSDVGVYWVVGSSATLGTNTAFEGNILASESITLNTGATIFNGRALALNGAVTLDTNVISNICPDTSELPSNVTGPGSSSPNSGPGFSGGLEFDDNGDLVPIYRYSLEWEKRDDDGELLGGAQFTISPDPFGGTGIFTILDNGPGDSNPANGQILIENIAAGTYTITEVVAPLGYTIDDDPERIIDVSGLDLTVTLGIQGVDDELDFHNTLIVEPVGSVAWEKRDADGNLLGGAQFTITPDPFTGTGIFTILDNGPGDANPAVGQILVNNVLPGTYTITETVAPLGYEIDPDPSRTVEVTLDNLNVVIGIQGVDDELDFRNSLIEEEVGSIAWEKRDAEGNLLGGAQFTITPDPFTGTGIFTILDNGPGDANPAVGQILVNNVLPGTYTITETVAPLGYEIDPDPSRTVEVTLDNLNVVIGIQGVDDELDFRNSLIEEEVGSIAWEKRDADGNLLGGAQFTITPDPFTGTGVFTILDNGPGDANPAIGQILVNNVLPGTYTITETVAPLGYEIDPDPSRTVEVTLDNLNVVIGIQGVDDELDFRNSLIEEAVGSIAWEKRDADGNLLGGAQFTITPDPFTGTGVFTILDNGPGDADPAIGQILVNNVLPGTYTITETVAPLGYEIDPDPSRTVTVTVDDLNVVIGIQGVDDELDFRNRRINLIVIGDGKSPNTPQQVTVLDADTGEVVAQFIPFGDSFQGGIHVATGDLTGDGNDEIVVAPGWSIAGEVRVYTQTGDLLTSFFPYGTEFQGGVHVAVGDVDGDGLADIVTVPMTGASQVKVFRNVLVDDIPTFDVANPYQSFLAFPASYIGGAVVAVADMGSTSVGTGSFDTTQLDQRSEIIVGSRGGMQATVKVFDVTQPQTLTPTATPAGMFTPFSTDTFTYNRGVSLTTALINDDLIPDIVVGSGPYGGSRVDVWAWNLSTSATLSSLSANGLGFTAFTGTSQTASVEVAAQDTNGDGLADTIYAVQGPGGDTNQIRKFEVVSYAPLVVSPYTIVPGDYPRSYFIDSLENPSAGVSAVVSAAVGEADPIPLEDEIDVVASVFLPDQFATAVNAEAARSDFDQNGVVGMSDFLLFISHYGQSVGEESPEAYRYDLNQSGVVDLGDFLQFIQHYGYVVPSDTETITLSAEPLASPADTQEFSGHDDPSHDALIGEPFPWLAGEGGDAEKNILDPQPDSGDNDAIISAYPDDNGDTGLTDLAGEPMTASEGESSTTASLDASAIDLIVQDDDFSSYNVWEEDHQDDEAEEELFELIGAALFELE